MERDELISFLNTYLEVDRFKDYCRNGLQVQGAAEVMKIVSGVTVSRRLIQEAIVRKAELILVHHGLFKGDIPDPPCFCGVIRERLALLLSQDINLVGYHLPLDAHPEIGNNVLACRELGLENLQPLDVGFIGDLPFSDKLSGLVDKVRNIYGRELMTFEFGSSEVQRIAIISGGSSYLWEVALEAEADLFICGDMKESLVRKIEEAKLNVIVAGHYHTETLGIKALSQIIQEKFQIQISYVDIPSPV
ncbi:MAG: Nif3-like dinuclear metal center hexameric protein [bacterium]